MPTGPTRLTGSTRPLGSRTKTVVGDISGSFHYFSGTEAHRAGYGGPAPKAPHLLSQQPAYKFAPHCLADLRKHPNAPPKFVALANENPERVEVRKLDVNGCRHNIGYFPRQEWSVFTALDVPSSFDGMLQPKAIYYVVTDHVFRLGSKK